MEKWEYYQIRTFGRQAERDSGIDGIKKCHVISDHGSFRFASSTRGVHDSLYIN